MNIYVWQASIRVRNAVRDLHHHVLIQVKATSVEGARKKALTAHRRKVEQSSTVEASVVLDQLRRMIEKDLPMVRSWQELELVVSPPIRVKRK